MNGWEEKKLCHLKPRILKFFGEFEVVTIQTLMGGVKCRIDQIRIRGDFCILTAL